MTSCGVSLYMLWLEALDSIQTFQTNKAHFVDKDEVI